MKPILVVNPEEGWDNVSYIFDAETMTDEQFKELEELCNKYEYILIDWKSVDKIESFLSNHD